VRNVVVAVDLARHIMTGWHDRGLDQDYRSVSNLLHVSQHDAELHVREVVLAELARQEDAPAHERVLTLPPRPQFSCLQDIMSAGALQAWSRAAGAAAIAPEKVLAAELDCVAITLSVLGRQAGVARAVYAGFRPQRHEAILYELDRVAQPVSFDPGYGASRPQAQDDDRQGAAVLASGAGIVGGEAALQCVHLAGPTGPAGLFLVDAPHGPVPVLTELAALLSRPGAGAAA